jgi:hypothetical protein
MPLRGILGSALLRARPDWRVINPYGTDDSIALIPAIRPGFALFHAECAEREGNVCIRDRPARRFPGSFGSAYLYLLVPKVILFKQDHTPRLFVPQDFISAAGVTPPNLHGPGGPRHLATSLALFDFANGHITLRTPMPGHTVEEMQRETGFGCNLPAARPQRRRRRRRTNSRPCAARYAKRWRRSIRSSRPRPSTAGDGQPPPRKRPLPTWMRKGRMCSTRRPPGRAPPQRGLFDVTG